MKTSRKRQIKVQLQTTGDFHRQKPNPRYGPV